MRLLITPFAASVLILTGCTGSPASPSGVGTTAPSAGRASRLSAAVPSAVLIAPAQVVIARNADGGTERLWFQARFTVRGAGGGGQAQMDGAILVVSAADGPMPAPSPRSGTALRIVVHEAFLASDGVVRFEGSAAVGRETRVFVSGSASPHTGSPDDLIIDIVGGDLPPPSSPATFGYRFTAAGKLVTPRS